MAESEAGEQATSSKELIHAQAESRWWGFMMVSCFDPIVAIHVCAVNQYGAIHHRDLLCWLTLLTLFWLEYAACKPSQHTGFIVVWLGAYSLNTDMPQMREPSTWTDSKGNWRRIKQAWLYGCHVQMRSTNTVGCLLQVFALSFAAWVKHDCYSKFCYVLLF